MAPAIVVENVSKRYRIGGGGADKASYRTLRDDLAHLAAWPVRWARGQTGGGSEFWALKDVSFEVQPGEVVGIIGRNGAGKSTLLKVLSRITRPTSGRVRLRGRVGSLLEVGTGFHPELTGRENVYLSGSILGMTRAEMRRKFDEIVAFAEVEQFLDTPAKRYSSGMYMRLAFAVMAHLDPEILLVDEVLAVGDAQFQKKCLGKMGEVAKGGRTVLVVSHQMQVVQAIARRAILLAEGVVEGVGTTPKIIQQYAGSFQSAQDLGRVAQTGNGEGRFTSLRVSTATGAAVETVEQGEPLVVHFALVLSTAMAEVNIALAVRNGEGTEVFSDTWWDCYDAPLTLAAGDYGFRVRIPTTFLRPGAYWLTLCATRDTTTLVAMARGLELPPVVRTRPRRYDIDVYRWGVVYVPCEWSQV